VSVYATAAVYYLKRGYSPLPLPPKQKTRPPEGFTGHDGAIPTSEQVEWWTLDRPDWNIALRLPADVVGVDVDDYDKAGEVKRGLQELAALEEELGALPPTVMATSRVNGSGIRLYRIPTGTLLVNGCGDSIEFIQRHHRYVVAPPSIHPEGREYRWLEQASGEVLDTVPAVEDLPALPWQWIERFEKATGGTVGPVADEEKMREFLDEHGSGELESWLDQIRRNLDKGRTLGARHDTLVDVACDAMREAAAGAYPARKAVEVLLSWWLEVVEDPERRDGDEFRSAISWAIGQAIADPEQVAKIRERVAAWSPLEIWQQFGVAVPSVPPLQDETAEAGDDGAFRLADLLDVAGVVEWSSFWSEPRGEQEWIIPELVAKGRASVLYAKAKQGKSTIALAAVAAIATGRLVFGVHPSPRRRVLYLDYEMTRDDLRDRLEELGYDETADLSHLHYALLPSLRPLDTPQGAAQLVTLARHYEVDLVVIDTFGRAVDGPENEADTVRDYFRCTGAALKRAGIASLRADHAGKDIKKGQRGSSGKTDDVDLVWELTRGPGEVVNIKRTHSRITWASERIQLRRIERDGIVEYLDTSATEVDPEIVEVVAMLDRLKLPNHATNAQARAALKANGAGRSNAKISAACSVRRRRSVGSGTVPKLGNASGNDFEHSSGTTTGNVTPEAGTPYAPRGTEGGTDGEQIVSERGTSRSPLGLRDVPHRLGDELGSPQGEVDPAA